MRSFLFLVCMFLSFSAFAGDIQYVGRGAVVFSTKKMAEEYMQTILDNDKDASLLIAYKCVAYDMCRVVEAGTPIYESGGDSSYTRFRIKGDNIYWWSNRALMD